MGKNRILLVEDNASILFNISLLLELNNFEVVTATNGKNALEKLDTLDKMPDLILSDILMPEINGYQLLETISDNPKWDMIPFIFLSAKAAPDDIRLGKLLGADDYLTKPVDDELLISLIIRKIQKVSQLESEHKKKLESEIFSELKQILQPSLTKNNKSSIYLFIVEWDERLGPVVTKRYAENSFFNIDLETIGIQLFQTTVSLFGSQGVISPEYVLLNVRNIHMKSLILFDAIPDTSIRGNQKQIMISVIAPEISYLDSLKLKNTLFSIASEIKTDSVNDLGWYFEEVQTILVKGI